MRPRMSSHNATQSLPPTPSPAKAPVTKPPLVAGQWQRKSDKFELVIIANKPAPEIPVGGKLQLLS